MKLSYLQSIDPCDPLPKLGRKVGPEPSETAEQKRLAAVMSFESYGHELTFSQRNDYSPMPEAVFAVRRVTQDQFRAMYEPEPVVSFADAAEMADGWIEWEGIVGPIMCGSFVDIRFSDGAELSGVCAFLDCKFPHDRFQDIIAYRIHKEPEKKAPTFNDVIRAFYAARENFTLEEIQAAITPMLEGVGHKPGMPIDDFPQAFPALIAALEALGR